MPKTRDDLFAFLDGLGIATETTEHPAVYTVEEAKAHRGSPWGELDGAHCKNLFLKDKKGALYLVVADEDRAIDMKELRHKIGAHHLSFGKPDLLMEVLGVEPGSVTVLALINDTDRRVNVVIDAAIMEHAVLNCHPLVNTATTRIATSDVIAFVRACGHDPQIRDLA
ncbi:MAG: prolyl-tRNA synthetase associated domain-containing protein [Rhodospirillales bacterium]